MCEAGITQQMRKLSVKFRYHNGQLADFGAFPFSFAIEFTQLFPNQPRKMNNIIQNAEINKISFKLIILATILFSVLILDLFFNFHYNTYVYLFFIEIILLVYKFRNSSILTIILLFSSLKPKALGPLETMNTPSSV